MSVQRGAAAVMDMSLFVLLLLSGLLCSASGLWREYHFMNQNMSWTEAQSYCRERFTDLATVDSMDNVNDTMNTVNDGYSGSVWIGLKRGTQSRWAWSMGDHILTQYSAWKSGEPNRDGDCVFFHNNQWCDGSCAQQFYFVCYDETAGYIMIYIGKNWTDAQSYCRQHHTDLATINSSVETNQIFSLINYRDYWDVWIGLFFDSWQWSDQWSLFFRNWVVGQQFQTSGSDCVAMSTTDSGKWIPYSCDLQRPFICYGEDKLVKKQTVRFDFTHNRTYSLTNSSLQTAILNKISEKLKSLGLEGYKNISWINDKGGEVFHLSKHTINSNNICNFN